MVIIRNLKRVKKRPSLVEYSSIVEERKAVIVLERAFVPYKSLDRISNMSPMIKPIRVATMRFSAKDIQITSITRSIGVTSITDIAFPNTIWKYPISKAATI